MSDDLVPLSFQQEAGYRFLKNDGAHWFMPYAFRISGALQVNHLRNCLNSIVARHESLRTRIVLVRDQPMQRIVALENDVLSIQDFTGHAAEDPEIVEAVEKLFRSEINLETECVFVVRLLRLNDQEHVLAVAIHHMMFDRMSAVILFDELWTLYENSVAAPILSPMKVQYRDYSSRQRHDHALWLSRHEAYWSRKLKGAQPVRMPADPGQREKPTNAAELRFYLDSQSSLALRQFASNKQVFFGLVILTVFTMLIARWSGQYDFVLPFVVSGRDRPEHLRTIGWFAHCLFMRMQVGRTDTFTDLLEKTTAEFFTSWAHIDGGRLAAICPVELLYGTALQWVPWNPAEIQGAPRRLLRAGNGEDEIKVQPFTVSDPPAADLRMDGEIGRASCRERV